MKVETNVATKIEQLLQRCDQLKRAKDIRRPTRFNAAGERHANQVAARDAAVHRGQEQPPKPP